MCHYQRVARLRGSTPAFGATTRRAGTDRRQDAPRRHSFFGVLENRSPLDQAFVQGLRDQGYLEGKNLIIERRYNSSKLKDNAHELAGMKLDAILTTYRATAAYIDKIKKSANPANLPVEQPTRFELVINMKTAKALGLSVPQSLLMRADNVIQ